MAKISVFLPHKIGMINPNIYGHFVEHLGGVVYDGIWVGEDSSVPNIHGMRKEIIDKLKAINTPVIRWPGGCFAETYDWRDGIGPKKDRPTTVNWWYNNDGLYESNQMGTHEFADFCRLTGAEPYFALNATTTTALEGRNWIEYCNMAKDSTTLARLRGKNGDTAPLNIPYWGLGNENWGGGGAMTPEDYCAVYRKYGVMAYSVFPQGKYIACGANDSIPDWTQKFFERYQQMYTEGRKPPLYGYSLHYYVSNFGKLGSEMDYTEEQWYEALRMAWGIESFIERQAAMIDAAMPDDQIALIVDEWGLWHQQNGRKPINGRYLFEQDSNMREAVLAAISLNVFNNHCDRVKMTNIAQLVNCIHSLFLAREDQCVTTTTYHVYDMFKVHQSAEAVKTLVESGTKEFTIEGKQESIAEISCSASVKDGVLSITLANTSIESEQNVQLDLFGGVPAGKCSMTTLSTANHKDGNTFDEPNKVLPKTVELELDPVTPVVTLPKASVALITIPMK